MRMTPAAASNALCFQFMRPPFRAPSAIYGPDRASPALLCPAGAYVHDSGGALSFGSHDELASVEGAKRSPVAHAEQGDVGEPLAQEPVEPCFGRLVQCRGRLVEEEPVGFLDKCT